MSTTAETLTEKLHARSDKKLREYCEQKFGNLFDECGGQSNRERPDIQEFERLQQVMNTAGFKSPFAFPWHGTVWALAREVLFAMLRDKWREREVSEFIDKVENVNSIWEGGDA